MWRTVEGCAGQLRVGMGGVFGLDFTAVAAKAALGGPLTAPAAALMDWCLPEIELTIIQALRKGDET